LQPEKKAIRVTTCFIAEGGIEMSRIETGIASMGLQLPPLAMPVEELAALRGVDPNKYLIGLGCSEIALCPPDFGIVELSAGAARRALSRWDGDVADIGMIAVGTETAVDMSRPLSAFVADRLGLAGRIRSYEVKHACYGGTLALRQACEWRMSGAARGKAALVIAADIALYEPGGAHEFAPSKRPRVRLRTMELAGELRLPFTTGILIGIGETRADRIESLLAIRDLRRRFGHIQEVIVQNFRAKPGTAMAGRLDADTIELLWSVAAARLILGPDANVQVPPNLSSDNYQIYLEAGINDWGGVSPLTIDFVNPEAPWPALLNLKEKTEASGFELKPRLPVYPEYFQATGDYLPEGLLNKVRALAGDDGYVQGGIQRYVGKN